VSVPIVVTVQGDYPTIRQFITDLQNTRRVFLIDSVVFSLSDARGQRILRATITVNLEYFGNAN